MQLMIRILTDNWIILKPGMWHSHLRSGSTWENRLCEVFILLHLPVSVVILQKCHLNLMSMELTQTMPLSGKLNTFTGGLLLGAQWKLGGKYISTGGCLDHNMVLLMDCMDGKKTLNAQEQQELRNELQDMDIPFAETTTTVDANGARLDIKGPWAGLRAGLCLGIRF
jgi:hypothetical protein